MLKHSAKMLLAYKICSSTFRIWQHSLKMIQQFAFCQTLEREYAFYARIHVEDAFLHAKENMPSNMELTRPPLLIINYILYNVNATIGA